MTIDENFLLLNPIDGARDILDLPFGVHCLVVYANLNKCGEFYSYYVQEIMKKATQIIEINPFYETENAVRDNIMISHYHKTMAVDKVEDKDNILLIVDSLKKYHNITIEMDNVVVYDEDFDNILLIVDSLKKYSINSDALPYNKLDKILVDTAKELEKEGATIIWDMGVFKYQHKMQELINYEALLPRHFDIDIKRVCLLHNKDFETLSENNKESLINHHELVLKID